MQGPSITSGEREAPSEVKPTHLYEFLTQGIYFSPLSINKG